MYFIIFVQIQLEISSFKWKCLMKEKQRLSSLSKCFSLLQFKKKKYDVSLCNIPDQPTLLDNHMGCTWVHLQF